MSDFKAGDIVRCVNSDGVSCGESDVGELGSPPLEDWYETVHRVTHDGGTLALAILVNSAEDHGPIIHEYCPDRFVLVQRAGD